MIGHLSFGVTDLPRSMLFYDAAMTELGYARVWASQNGVGYGVEAGKDKLALFPRPEARSPGAGFHLAFDAASREAVDRFHAAAIAAGGTSDGAPGLRPHYGATYYAAFVIDPDGYKLEAAHQ
ncbi:MAG TPA: VOC family protein [Caulobacteraceae bacterium]|jgi:catechol 2,3-dioxygenase-like lactoylglutathione lyase family enzyme|nr:VOC family protein [Caulobacteraceae bacterium]